MPKLIVLSLVFAFFLSGVSFAVSPDPNPATLHSEKGAWPLYRQWTPAETQHYAAWIENLFDVKDRGTREQQLAKLEATLTDPQQNLLLDPGFVGSPSNPQLDTAVFQKIHPVLDCGKLTVMLTAYYAYRRGLPWMITSIHSGDGTDIRYSSFNIPSVGRSNLEYTSASEFFVDAVYGFCTGNYRVNPDGVSAGLSDTVPVAVTREALIPGALYYLDGHVLILAKIDPYGGLKFLDSTTSPTRDIYTFNGLNAVSGLTPSRSEAPQYAGCYRGFRVFRYPIAETDEAGNVLSVRRRTDKEMAAFGYSLEQYDRLRELMETRKIKVDGIAVDNLHDFVRVRMRTAEHIDPVEVMETFATDFIQQLAVRDRMVQASWKRVQSDGPITFPEGDRDANIFSARGAWGEYSSAGFDAKLRADYFEMVDNLTHAIQWYHWVPGYVTYAPSNDRHPYDKASLALALRAEKARIFGARHVTVHDDAGEQVQLSLLEVESRLFDMSFDPNHPPSVRWGKAPQNGGTLATPLPNGKRLTLAESYRNEAYYRAMTYREVVESHLQNGIYAGYPIRPLLDAHLAQRWRPGFMPPLVPKGFKLAMR